MKEKGIEPGCAYLPARQSHHDAIQHAYRDNRASPISDMWPQMCDDLDPWYVAVVALVAPYVLQVSRIRPGNGP